jgi:hypothetical protein
MGYQVFLRRLPTDMSHDVFSKTLALEDSRHAAPGSAPAVPIGRASGRPGRHRDWDAHQSRRHSASGGRRRPDRAFGL